MNWEEDNETYMHGTISIGTAKLLHVWLETLDLFYLINHLPTFPTCLNLYSNYNFFFSKQQLISTLFAHACNPPLAHSYMHQLIIYLMLHFSLLVVEVDRIFIYLL